LLFKFGVLIFWHCPERRFKIFAGDAELLPKLGGSPDEQAAWWWVDVDGEGDPGVAVHRGHLLRGGDREKEELAIAQ
jgi:hypothetical protein